MIAKNPLCCMNASHESKKPLLMSHFMHKVANNKNINKVNASNGKKFLDSAEWIPSSEDVASKFDGWCKKVVQFKMRK